MADPKISNARLRTKTGCTSCRNLRRKCDEQKPQCQHCVKVCRQCTWPNEDALPDRRYRRQSRHSDKSGSPKSDVDEEVLKSSVACNATSVNPVNPTTLRSQHEIILFQQFTDCFHPKIHLPTAHTVFQKLSSYLVHMALNDHSLKDVLVACGAMDRYMITKDPMFRRLGLSYYSKAMASVNQSLRNLTVTNGYSGDELISTIGFLYVFGMWGPDASNDISCHVTGATQLIKLRYMYSAVPSTAKLPYARLMIESILYQEFLVTCADPFQSNIKPDWELWGWAEENLSNLTLPDGSDVANSPVLGVDISLYSLILKIIQFCREPLQLVEGAEGKYLRMQIGVWKDTLGPQHSLKKPYTRTIEDPYKDLRDLYILSASLLFDWARISKTSEHAPNFPPDENCQQVRQAMEILKDMDSNDPCMSCYLGTWPLFILGYAVVDEDDINLVQRELERRWDRSPSGDVKRALDRLQSVWYRRRTCPSASHI